MLTSAALGYLALALRIDPAVFPFSTAKRRQERAVILGAAACAAAHGAPLHDALSAGAGLSVSPQLREEASLLAGAMREGAPGSGASAPDLLGTLGAALFSTAASRGEGESALSALADAAEAGAAADLPNQVLRAELTSILVASAAIAVGGILIYQTYTAALPGL